MPGMDMIKDGFDKERAHMTFGTPPEHDCPVCGAKAGDWCVILPAANGYVGWQHDDRPASSWEKS